MFAELRLADYASRVTLFGENVKRLRERAGLTQEGLALKLGLKRPAPVSLMEGPRKHLIPKEKRIRQLAAALNAQPWELLQGVETEIDKLRGPPLSLVGRKIAPSRKVDLMSQRQLTLVFSKKMSRSKLDSARCKPLRVNYSESFLIANVRRLEREHPEAATLIAQLVSDALEDL